MKDNQREFILIARISIRKENFGGLVFVPSNGEVIQLNHSAYEIVNYLVQEGQIVVNGNLTFWQELKERKLVKEVLGDNND